METFVVDLLLDPIIVRFILRLHYCRRLGKMIIRSQRVSCGKMEGVSSGQIGGTGISISIHVCKNLQECQSEFWEGRLEVSPPYHYFLDPPLLCVLR